MSTRSVDDPPSDIPFLSAFLERAARAPGLPALLEKRRGAWSRREWRDVVEEVDRLASGLTRLGVKRGDVVAIDGEINGRLLLVAAATAALGALIRSIPTRASREDRDRVVDDPSVAAVVGRGREVVAEWTQLSAQGRLIPIVFDHATAGSRAPAERVVTFERLRALAPPSGWRERLAALAAGPAPATVWIEETTDWIDGLDEILNTWVERGVTLALPELLAASDRDRRGIEPEAWLASADTLERAAERIRERLPAEGSLSSALVSSTLNGTGRFSGLVLRPRLRALFGLARLDRIEVHADGRRAPSAGANELFERLGAPPRIARKDAPASREGGVGERASLVAAEGAAS